MAASKPSGNATKSAIADVRKVPLTSGQMPKCFSANKGVHCTSATRAQGDTTRKNSKLSNASTATMPTVVSTLTSAQVSRPPSSKRSAPGDTRPRNEFPTPVMGGSRARAAPSAATSDRLETELLGGKQGLHAHPYLGAQTSEN